MMNNNQATFGSRWFLSLQVLLLLLVVSSLCYANAVTPAGTIISNMAIGEYKEQGSTVVQTSRSNLVQTTIIPVNSFTLQANRLVQASAGQRVFFSHELTNTGNIADRYNLAAANVTNGTSGDAFDYSDILVYLDANRDGVPDGAAISSYSVAAGQSVGLLVGATVPVVTVAALNADVVLNATSQGNAQVLQNTDRSTVTNQAVILIRKAFSQTQANFNDVVTVRLDYENRGSVATGSVNITDTLTAAQLSYVAGGENWNGQAVDPATGNNDPVGIDYSVSGNTITAILSSVPANSSGFIEFKVKVNQASAGQIPNTVQLSYDHDNNNGTANLNTVSNKAILNISPRFAVEINAISTSTSSLPADNIFTAPAVASGGEIIFRNYVWNTGNTADRFNLTFSNDSFPAPHQVEFYRADGVTPLLDSNGDGIPDTGLLAVGEKLDIVVRLRTPTTFAAATATNYSVFPRAQSIGDSSKFDTVEDRSSFIITNANRLVDLINSPEATNNGTGNGSIKNGSNNAWKTLSVNSSATVTFPLSVKHVGAPTAYDLSVDSDGNFAQVELPTGVSTVRFYESTGGNCTTLGQQIEQTRLLADGESQLYCAVLAIATDAATASNVPVYFKVASATYVSSNNSSNVGFDTLLNAINITSLNSVGSVVLTPDLRGQVAPNGTIVYSHTLNNNAATALTGSHTLEAVNDKTGFNTTLYLDANNDGVLDTADTIITPTTNINSTPLAAGMSLRIFAKVQNTGYNGVGVVNTTVIKLLNSASAEIAKVTDITTITATQIRLLKLQALDATCDGTADGSYTAATLTIGRNADGSGQCVLYRVTVQNQGALNIGEFTFRDNTPASTVMAFAPSCTACTSTSLVAPAIGESGKISGIVPAVASGASHTFEFGVKYVGQ